MILDFEQVVPVTYGQDIDRGFVYRIVRGSSPIVLFKSAPMLCRGLTDQDKAEAKKVGYIVSKGQYFLTLDSNYIIELFSGYPPKAILAVRWGKIQSLNDDDRAVLQAEGLLLDRPYDLGRVEDESYELGSCLSDDDSNFDVRMTDPADVWFNPQPKLDLDKVKFSDDPKMSEMPPLIEEQSQSERDDLIKWLHRFNHQVNEKWLYSCQHSPDLEAILDQPLERSAIGPSVVQSMISCSTDPIKLSPSSSSFDSTDDSSDEGSIRPLTLSQSSDSDSDSETDVKSDHYYDDLMDLRATLHFELIERFRKKSAERSRSELQRLQQRIVELMAESEKICSENITTINGLKVDLILGGLYQSVDGWLIDKSGPEPVILGQITPGLDQLAPLSLDDVKRATTIGFSYHY